MKQYTVSGMSCAACSAAVEKAVSSVEGVTSCSVSLLTNSMGVEGTAPESSVIAAVEKAGYGASLQGADSKANESFLTDTETARIRKRLLWSLGFLLILMYFSMGHMLFGFPLPPFFENNLLAVGILQLILAAIVMVINQKFFVSGTKSLLHRTPNMDTLVALGSGTSFVWSAYALLRMTAGEPQLSSYAAQLYFESAAMILVLITVGKLLEAKSKGKTTNALKALMRIKPETATVLRGGKESVIPIEELRVGDIFTVRAGERIPADGKVIEGSGAVNEAALTGESIPVEKAAGNTVSAATINEAGFLTCEALKVGEDTTLAQIIKTVSDAAATKAPIAKIADKVSGIFVPVVISIAAVTFVIWLIAGKEISFALARAVSVLVISCPCALGLATPVAITVGNGLGAKSGILFKTAQSLEQTGKIQIAVMDKTGTVTQGTPVVTDVIPAADISQTDLLTLAYTLEKKSEHPLAKAVCKKAEENELRAAQVEKFQTFAGNGIEATLGGQPAAAGNLRFMKENAIADHSLESVSQALALEGKTPLFFAKNKTLYGVIAVQDTAKTDALQAIRELKDMGIVTVMLTGDNQNTAAAIAAAVGIDKVIADVLPAEKAAVVRGLKQSGVTAMVGDGINDAPALTEADIGIAVGSGTDVAIDAADIVLMNNRLTDVAAAVRLGRKTLRTIKQNLFWAFFYNAICIPVAAGALIPAFGIALNPMMGAAAMSFSSFFVVMNALRLNLFNIHSPQRDKQRPSVEVKIEKTNQPKGEKPMIIKVEGMMCPHCEARVKTALEALEGVQSAKPSHEKGEVEIAGTADAATIEKAITEAGYTFKGIR
ncbi:MAG: heavy metal translocating P-type ATPase [Ruminococcaceae bacterium]|nr:heavy metal translocating P-type ATPase [Oscillospiraceae bacterium]